MGDVIDLPLPLGDDDGEPESRFRVCRRRCSADAGADPFGLCPAHRAEYDEQATSILGTRPRYGDLAKYGRSRAYRRSALG